MPPQRIYSANLTLQFLLSPSPFPTSLTTSVCSLPIAFPRWHFRLFHPGYRGDGSQTHANRSGRLGREGHSSDLGYGWAGGTPTLHPTTLFSPLHSPLPPPQEMFRAIICAYFRGARGVLLMFDVSSKNTFNSLDSWFAEARPSISLPPPPPSPRPPHVAALSRPLPPLKTRTFLCCSLQSSLL